MKGAVEQTRYLNLRQQLASLGYTSFSFGADATDLITQLLNDLTTASEAYEAVQAKDVRLSQDLAMAQAQLFPLRKENARLAKENYQVNRLLERYSVYSLL